MQDRIEKTVDLKAPVSRVWQAITDHRQFGEWFRVNLDTPFEVGKTTRGPVTYPGYDALIRNTQGWDAQAKNIAAYVET